MANFIDYRDINQEEDYDDVASLLLCCPVCYEEFSVEADSEEILITSDGEQFVECPVCGECILIP